MRVHAEQLYMYRVHIAHLKRVDKVNTENGEREEEKKGGEEGSCVVFFWWQPSSCWCDAVFDVFETLFNKCHIFFYF